MRIFLSFPTWRVDWWGRGQKRTLNSLWSLVLLSLVPLISPPPLPTSPPLMIVHMISTLLSGLAPDQTYRWEVIRGWDTNPFGGNKILRLAWLFLDYNLTINPSFFIMIAYALSATGEECEGCKISRWYTPAPRALPGAERGRRTVARLLSRMERVYCVCKQLYRLTRSAFH